ncbi:hypothetical protein L1787_21180 [Acuticoccus sp. M5D2P5]|uniref:calcium-binding protein n=1 Tax=Acuticoccus kalidii TaxID=2910977 RepID=UPI001F39F882|nr:calcium-binding protein [Acuticoccus kalidii]MCF3935906.1 hypothetical protein [Acuticoccus kalidii]
MATEITTLVEEQQTDPVITVTPSGELRGYNIIDIDAFHTDISIASAGTIQGHHPIMVSGSGSHYVIRNTGQIRADTVDNSADPDRFEDDWDFYWSSSIPTKAITTSGKLSGLIVNRGEITSPDGYTLNSGSYTDYDGVALDLDGRAETVVNAGTIRGDIVFHDRPGADAYLGAAGSVVEGTVDFGDQGGTAKNHGTLDSIFGGEGRLRVVNFADGEIDYVSGRDAADIVHNFGTITSGVSLGDGDDLYNAHGSGTVTGLSGVDGGQGDDTLIGGDGVDWLYGGEGADRIVGGGGDDRLFGGTTYDETGRPDGQSDTLIGGAGNDRLDGQHGDDVLAGGEGRDWLTGGDGADTFIAQRGGGVDIITDFARKEGDAILLKTIDLPLDTILANAKVVGGDTVLKFGQGDVMILEGVTHALNAEDFIV